ncbi:MAG: glycosyltransferase family 2 protein, partial [Candidatus Cloacimonetes bacterium]|nr:glycosyltransferase family 2 protein [Candidatus Cloacimonadota bacterium]
NEEEYIEEKLQSFANLDYPKDKINLIIVSDNSDDDTNFIVQKYVDKFDNIRLVIQKTRKGKASALNLIEPKIDSEIVISTDASSILEKDAVKKMVRHFNDDSIGLVTGKLKYVKKNNDKSGEGLYWKYETWIRKNESKVYSVIVASGCLFAIRRELYKQIHPSSPDDFERTLVTLENGYRAIIEPEAVVYEYLTVKTSDEISRKIRIISREWFALLRHKALLNFFKFPIISLFLISHKLIRWLLPFISISIIGSAIFLRSILFMNYFLCVTAILFGFGLLELLLEKNGKSIKLFKVPAYIIAMNYASSIAFMKFIFRKQQTIW